MTSYARDINQWSIEQAAYLRAGRLDKVDFKNIAEEIEDVGKSEKRELKSRLAVLLCHLLKSEEQPERSGSSWERTIKEQRKALNLHLKEVPSLKQKLHDPDFIEAVWSDAVTLTIKETGIVTLPEQCPWDLVTLLKG